MYPPMKFDKYSPVSNRAQHSQSVKISEVALIVTAELRSRGFPRPTSVDLRSKKAGHATSDGQALTRKLPTNRV